MARYDIIIVGGGPAGIFTALELIRSGLDLNIILLEKGKDIEKRFCPLHVKDVSCRHCAMCDILSGWGGAGAFSDGKLTLSPEIGGFLGRYLVHEELTGLIRYVDETYMSYGAPKESYGGDTREVRELQEVASKHNLILIPSLIRHLGTDRCAGLLKKLKNDINNRAEIRLNTAVKEIIVRERKAIGVHTDKGEEFSGDYIILAPGREGSEWLNEEAKRLNLTALNNPVDIGVRVELPAPVLEPLTKITYEPKLFFYSRKFDDKVRTFCVNPYGEVVKEYSHGISTVNGHSYSDKKTNNTNFAILVSTYFTEPFHEPIAYGQYIARLANILGMGVIVQRLGDLQMGRRSTYERISRGIVEPTLKDATPGDLSFVIPYRYLSDILEMLEAMDKIAPGVNSRHTLLYGVEVKFYSMLLKLTNSLETEVKNLFAIGDGAGVSRGLVQASASGVVVARELIKRLKDVKPKRSKVGV
ncbi:MAG: NAD(P)/FAD-dependent oxidoreductase [Nitrospirota bacterium]